MSLWRAVRAGVLACAWGAACGLSPAQQPTPPPQDFIAPAAGSYGLPVIQAAADGWVLERNWTPRRLSNYTHGALTLLSFVYTYCSDPLGCPLAYEAFDSVRRRALAEPALRGQVRLVSLSFDPNHDTPRAMQAYGGANARSKDLPWHFLTTYSTTLLLPILADFGQDVEVERDARGAATRTRTHLLKVFLLDRRGQVREIYSAAYLHPEVIVNDLKTLALETAGPAAAPRPRVADSQRADAAFGLPPRVLPAEVPRAAAHIELGRKLFFDRRLAANGAMSCAMCHVPEEGFTSHTSRTSLGIEGRSLRRNAPSLLNVAWQARLFHDGRESSLVAQAWMPLLHADEMANTSVGQVLARLRALPDYRVGFEHAFGGAGPSRHNVGVALATFQASLVAADSRFDRWRYGGQATALSALEQQGFELFAGKAGCTRCHLIGAASALLADGRFHATGAGLAPLPGRRFAVPLAAGVQTVLSDADLGTLASDPAPDGGRIEATQAAADRFAFKTPSLRNVAQTPPYMHDGSLPTLEAVVDFYDRGGGARPTASALLRPLALVAAEKRALVAFLRALDGSGLADLVARSRPAAAR